MVENGFYLLNQSYIDLVQKLGGKYNDNKTRPMFCCIKDVETEGLYWLIPTSDYSHRTQIQKDRINSYIKAKGIKSAFYFVGYTTKDALFKISNALPVTEKYISREYVSCGVHLILQDQAQIIEIRKKLYKILSYEKLYPNRLEQKITTIREYIVNELQQEKEPQNV